MPRRLKELVKVKSVLKGEILELEKRKGILQGEIDSSIFSTLQSVRNIGDEAASQIQQQVANIVKQLDSLFEDALRAGEAVGEMRQMVRKGEASEKSLENFLNEVRDRLGGN